MPDAPGFTVEAGVAAGETVDVEYYHIKSDSANVNSVGVLVTNTNSKAATITVNRESTVAGYPYNAAGHTNDNKPGARMLKYYFNQAAMEKSVVIPAGSSKWISGPYSSDPAQKVLTGRVQFTAPNISGLNCKVILCKAGTSKEEAAKYSVASMSDVPANAVITSGVYHRTDISATVPSSATSFKLSAYRGVGDGTDEYEYLATGYRGSNYLSGNFGVSYTLNGLGGKTIRLTPNFQSSGAKTCPAQFVYKIGDENWQMTPLMKSSGTSSCTISIPLDSAFKYILPGDNFGSVTVDVIH